MLTGIILIWILIKLQAPTWLFWLAGVKMTWSVFKYFCSFTKQVRSHSHVNFRQANHRRVFQMR